MFFPIFISRGKRTPKVKDGDQYTSEWWRRKAGVSAKQIVAARLTSLVHQRMVKKVIVEEYEIIKFVPTDNFSVDDILSKIMK